MPGRDELLRGQGETRALSAWALVFMLGSECLRQWLVYINGRYASS